MCIYNINLVDNDLLIASLLAAVDLTFIYICEQKTKYFNFSSFLYHYDGKTR